MLLLCLCVFVLLWPSLGGVPVAPQPSPVSGGNARPLLGRITSELMHQYLEGLCAFGPRHAGSVSCTLASEYIYSLFQNLGLSVEFHEWKWGGYQSRDVVATLPGLLPDSDGIYIVSGHYDTVPTSPGADDDGSGAMAVVAIAAALKDQHLNHTVKFITFSGEEVGTYGSFTYAREAYARDENIIAVLNMDMIGYANTVEGGKILRFFSEPRSTWIGEYAVNVSSRYHDAVDMTIECLPNYPGNDGQAFVDFGYDGVWIAHHDGYAWGHSANDSTVHTNWSYYVKATQFMLAMTWETAMRPVPVQVRLVAPLEGELYFFNRPVRSIALAKEWFSGLRGTTIILGRAMARAEVISSEPVAYVIFCMDGAFQSWVGSPPYEWKVWGEYAALWGKHTLSVEVYTTAGHRAYDEMDLHVFSFSDTFRYNHRPHLFHPGV